MLWQYCHCGERGIRTPETLLTFTRFPGVPLQPLEHLSLVKIGDFSLLSTAIFARETYLTSIIRHKNNDFFLIISIKCLESFNFWQKKLFF